MGNNNKKSHQSQSFIKDQSSPILIKLLKKIDIFSFIPVPKDQAVSSKQSLTGTLIFFTIFFFYIIYDFVRFVLYNPLISQVFYQKLNDQSYQLPRFALSFMSSNYLNQTDIYSQYLTYQMSQQMKDKGIKDKVNIPIYLYHYDNESQQKYQSIFRNRKQQKKYKNLKQMPFKERNNEISEDIETNWLDQQTKRFYNVIRFPSKPTFAKGLLYSTSQATYTKTTIYMCNLNINPQKCATIDKIKQFLAGGRVFLFVEDQSNEHPLSLDQNQNKFFIYNFFLIPQNYKRVTLNMQVQKTQIFPDYFWRWSTQTYTRIKISSILQQTSDVTSNFQNQTSLQLLGITLQLSPQIMNIRIQSLTIIDKFSMWGALWGVLFSIFALIFLSYNRQKYYRRNPDWDNFKIATKNKIINQSKNTSQNRIQYDNVHSNLI